MPCTNEAHSHEWVIAGTLSIEKCETRCGFCSSTKEYKPASALRKVSVTASPKALKVNLIVR